MDRSQRQRWRVQGIPLYIDTERLTDILRNHTDLQHPASGIAGPEAPNNGVRVLTLATEPQRRNPKRTATVHFEYLPPQLAHCREKLLAIESSLPNAQTTTLTIDRHFSDLTVLHSPPGNGAVPGETDDIQTNILFISGLGSHPIGSFVNKENGHLWLTDELPFDRPLARIFTYGYDTALVGSDSIAEIRNLGENLRAAICQLLDQSPIPLVIVTHSLGGLVAKDALFLMSECDADARRLALVAAVCFFGVPHNGMEIKHLLPMVNMQANQPLVASLNRIGSQVLDAQRENWRKTLMKAVDCDVFCFYELLPSPTAVLTDSGYRMEGPKEFLVDQHSARNCFRDSASSVQYVVGIMKTHSDLVKFGPRESTYQRFLHFLDQAYNRSYGSANPSHTKPPRKAILDDKAFIQDDKDSLLKSLWFAQAETRYDAIHDRQGSTCEWLLASQVWRDWLDIAKVNSHHGLLWIKGNAGTGKSTLMKFAVDHAPVGTDVVSFFFNARGHHELEKSTLGMYRSILYQLFKPLGLEDIKKVLSLAKIDLRKGPNEQERIWQLPPLQRMLRQAIEHKAARIPFILFVDALDECEVDEVRNMVTFFQDLGELAVQSKFRVCFSSRHYPAITAPKAVSLALETQHGHTQDIANYVRDRLHIGTSEDADKIRGLLRQKASGVFLWVVLVIKMLNEAHARGRKDELLEIFNKIPGDLKSLFNDIICHVHT